MRRWSVPRPVLSEGEARVEGRSSFTRRALALAIRGYRRWFSGRGPLRRVRCTFHDSETCSAFGLRAAREAPSARIALARIRRRIRRCGDASLFALDARVLGWGADFDRPLDELHAELVADEETDAVRAQVLSAREVASRWRGDIADVLAVRALRHASFDSGFALAQDGPGDGPVRALPAVRPRLRRPPSLALVARAFLWRLLAAATLAIPAALVAPLVGLAIAALAALPLAAFVRGQVARRARLAHQARAAALDDAHFASLANRCIVDAISAPRLHSTTPKPSM